MLICVLLLLVRRYVHFFFFFNDTATTEIYTLSLHDALPICIPGQRPGRLHQLLPEARLPGDAPAPERQGRALDRLPPHHRRRSEEHTSELQSRQYLVCRLLLEKKKNIIFLW